MDKETSHRKAQNLTEIVKIVEAVQIVEIV